MKFVASKMIERLRKDGREFEGYDASEIYALDGKAVVLNKWKFWATGEKEYGIQGEYVGVFIPVNLEDCE